MAEKASGEYQERRGEKLARVRAAIAEFAKQPKSHSRRQGKTCQHYILDKLNSPKDPKYITRHFLGRALKSGEIVYPGQ